MNQPWVYLCPFFLSFATLCGLGSCILRQGMEFTPPVLEVQSLKHWTAREILDFLEQMLPLVYDLRTISRDFESFFLIFTNFVVYIGNAFLRCKKFECI